MTSHFVKILICCVVLAWVCPASSKAFLPDEEQIRASFPFAVLDTQEIDLGRHKTGANISGSIRIKNTGVYDLVIAKVRSSCGLMVQTWPSNPIKPGEQAVINFRYDSKFPGQFNRLITLHTNAWQKNLVIEVKGEVVP